MIKEKNGKYLYALVFDFDWDIVRKCQEIKEDLGWQEFTFNDRKWRFKNVGSIDKIREKFGDTEIILDDEVKSDRIDLVSWEVNEHIRKSRSLEIKSRTETNFNVNGMKKDLFPYQKVGVEFLINNKGRAMLFDVAGVGKQLWVGEILPTPTGFKKMGELKVGDYVYGKDGLPTRVTAVYYQGNNPLYRFKLNDGSSCLCGLEHLWTVKDNNNIRRGESWQILSTRQLKDRKLKRVSSKGKTTSNYRIPFGQPFCVVDSILPIDPYSLGALIGDGCLGRKTICLSVPDNKLNVFNKTLSGLKKNFPSIKAQWNRYNPCPQVYFTFSGKKVNELRNTISKLGLNVKSGLRFIPETYKISSARQRLELLRGLMDTDGSSATGRGRTSFSTTSKKLANDVAELVRTLMGEARIRSYDRSKEGKNIEYHINIKIDWECPFSKESEKAKTWSPATRNRKGYGRLISSIEYERDDEAICITVEAEDGLYQIHDGIVTHNTATTLGYISHTDTKKVIVICPASVKFAWKDETMKWLGEDANIISGKSNLDVETWNRYRIHIINYDLLKKFMDFFRAVRFDLLVIDECHMVKSLKSIRSKCTKELATLAKSVIALSGTPLLNRPSELFNTLNMIEPREWPDFFKFAKRFCNAVQNHWGWDFSGSSNLDELKEKISTYYIRRTKEEVLPQLPPKIFQDIVIDLPEESKKLYKEAEKDFKNYVKKHKGNGGVNDLAQLSELRQITSLGKLEATAEMIDSIMENEKILVFSAYNYPLEQLKDHYGDAAVLMTGKIDSSLREDIVKKFQNDPKVRIFLGGTLSAGVGITLTAASSVIFIDYSWRPADHEQAHSRAHRPGAEYQSLHVYQMIANGTIDYMMKEILENKKEIFEKIFENGEDQQAEMIKSLFNKYFE